MNIIRKISLVLLSFLFLTFKPSDDPCVRIRKIIPTYLNSWSDKEEKKYQDCNDTTKYFIKMYEKEDLTCEGNIINQQKEGIWKYYFNGVPWYEKLYYHDKLIEEKSIDDTWIIFLVNDSLFYETTFSNGKLLSSGLLFNNKKYGVWAELDSTTQIKSYGKYSPELICNTVTMERSYPPYDIYDSTICYQRKDSTWLYFDTKNQLIKIEKYNKGKLIK